MWDKICDLFKEKPCYYIEFIVNGKERKHYCYSYKEAKGYRRALHDFEITDKTYIKES